MNNPKTVTLTAKQLIHVINAHNDSHLEMIADMYKDSHNGQSNELLEIIATYNKVLAKVSKEIIAEDNGDAFVQAIIDSFNEADAINKANLN